MREVNWKIEPFKSLNKLLKIFYDPYLYKDEGYVFNGIKLDKEEFLKGIPSNTRKICPYCNNYLQSTELDHFLPKDDFPFISCHPDNLIPSCHDSNKGDHKGTSVPLDWHEVNQAKDWFHPHWRSGNGRIKVEIEVTPNQELSAKIKAINHEDDSRVSNLDRLFKISKFWSEQIEGELKLIGSQVSDCLKAESLEPTEENVRQKLQTFASLKKLEIGKRGLAICHHALYNFAANDSAVVTDITRECLCGLQY